MERYRAEYRINKKGSECFRTQDNDQAQAKLAELSAKRPGVYTLQTRYVPVDRYGVAQTLWTGKTAWSEWR